MFYLSFSVVYYITRLAAISYMKCPWSSFHFPLRFPNILFQIFQTKDAAYDDYEVSRHGAVTMDAAKNLRGKNGYVINLGMSNGHLQTNDEDLQTDINFSRVQLNDDEQTKEFRRRPCGKFDPSDAVSKRNGSIRDGFVLTRDVSGRAAYWQKREDDSNKPEVFTNTSSGVLKDWKTPSQIRQMKDKVCFLMQCWFSVLVKQNS